MSTDQRSSQRSSLVRILSRWRRDETSKETAIPEEIEELQEGRLASSAGEERRSARALSAGHKWRTKVAKATTREQMIDLLAMEPTGAQLTPIHEAARQGRVHDVRAILSQTPRAKSLRDSRQATALHHASAEGFLEVIELLIDHNSDLNARDEHGETPLHWAVTCEKLDAIELLISKGADANILSGSLESPLHTAVRLQNSETVRTLLKFSQVDVNKHGEHGRTPLHVAATLNSIDIIEQLMGRRAVPCAQDANGMRPLQLTARCGGRRHVMEHLLKIAEEKLGYPPDLVVNFRDDDGMTALHHAVSGGNVEVAELLLERGCKLLDKQSNADSAFHLACSQGSLDMVKVIIDNCGLPVEEVVNAEDSTGQTALHKAAIFNHTETAKFLINLGANMDALDKFGRTALLLAAQGGATDCLRFLLSSGANSQVCDLGLRNVLHVAIQYGQEVAEAVLAELSVSRLLINGQDARGFTPLHYASKMGNLKPVERMLDLGATPNPKNNEQQSPLHFAAKYGRYQTARRLLQGPHGKQMINEEDRVGGTALHYACRNGFPRVVELLLSQGALVLKDRQGYTPLQSAALGGYPQCMSIILASHPYVINWKSIDGDTALHQAATAGHPAAVEYLLSEGAEIVHNKAGESLLDIAIANKNKAVALAALQHDRWREAMNLVNRNQGYPMLKLIETMSDVAKVVLDRSVSTSQLHPKDKNYWISYDFKYLVCEKPESLHKNQLHKVGVKNQVSPESGYSGNDSDDHNSISSEKPSSDETTLTLADEQEAIPLAALDKMVKCDRKDLLIHPLSSALLKSRWDSYGSLVFKLNTLAYVIFLIFLTSAVALVTETGMPNTNATRNQTHIQEKTLSSFGRVSQVIVVIFGILQLIKEIVQMFQLRLNYFADFTNYMEWTLYITSILFVAPVGTVEQDSYRMEVGAVAIFLAWINLLLYIQRIDVIGIYIVMFLEVLKTLIVVTSVFFVFIVAFGLTFYVLLYPTGELYFVTIPRSFLKMAEYLLGELEFEFYIDRADMPYPGLTWVIVLIMVIFLPIIFMNLLIGLAVGDIEGVRKNAQLKRLAMQVELHMEAERKLPKSLQKRLCKETLKEYPNRCCNHWENALLDISQVSNLLPAFEESESSQGIADLREKFDRTQMKLKEMSCQLSKQHELLRAIMQKMEIKAEADDKDDGMTLTTTVCPSTHL